MSAYDVAAAYYLGLAQSNPMALQHARAPLSNGIAELEMLVASLSAAVDASDRERDAAETAALIHKRDAAELERQVIAMNAVIHDLTGGRVVLLQQTDALRTNLGYQQERVAELETRVAELEAAVTYANQFTEAMIRERDYAVLRMEVAIATGHAWIDAEVRRPSQLLGIPEHVAPAFPASALRQQRQAIGLLSTADGGRVRLGGYAPSLPPR
jgi:hypothetical protein